MERTDDEWESFVTAVWEKRFRAVLTAYGLSIWRSVYATTETILQTIVTVGSVGTLLAVFAENQQHVAGAVATVVALCSGLLQGTKLSERTAKAVPVIAAWQRRAAYWTATWHRVKRSEDPGPIDELEAGDAEPTEQALALNFPAPDWFVEWLKRRIEATDSVCLTEYEQRAR